MKVLAIDPGPNDSAFVLFDGSRVVDYGQLRNLTMLERLKQRTFGVDSYITVIEQVEGFGMPVGAETFETVFWSGRFAQASRPFDRVKRKAIKRHLCGRTNVKDQDVRKAILARFHGLPVGVSGHKLAALAVAVTWWDIQQKAGAA